MKIAWGANTWLYICLDRDIQEGCYKTFDIFGNKIVAKREGGEIIAAKNRCRHRGFKVCDGAGNADTIKCPYHGLQYNFEERLKVQHSGEMIFVSHTDQPFLKLMLPTFGEEFGHVVQEVRAPFHLWIQNTADPNHLKTVHSDGFEKMFEGIKPKLWQACDEGWSWYSMPLKPEIINKYKKYLPIDPLQKHFVDNGFTHALYYPHVSITSFLGVFFSVETAVPVPGVYNCTQVYTRFFLREHLVVPPLMKKIAMDSNKRVLEEDKTIIEWWGEQYNMGSETWLPGEERIKHYVDWCGKVGICSIM